MNAFVFTIVLLTVTVELGLSQGYPNVYRDYSGGGRRRLCPRLIFPNGRVRNKPRIFAQFSCNPGYLLMGERYRKCDGGRWDGKLPVCVKPSCKIPQQPRFGVFFPSYQGAVLTFFCNPNYVLHGSNFTYCDGKTWNNYLPSCVREDSNASISCDFESPDLCGWSHSLNHDFTWERMNLRTPSGHVGTGPKHDHTKGEGETGYYMYIESSYKNENDTATLISPLHQSQIGKKTCLEFYYHMYGSGIGQLKLFVKFINRTWASFDWNLMYAISGNQGDVWHRGFVDLGDLDQDFQIIFQGIRGVSYVSDIAIDDVKLIENCVIDELTTATTEVIDTSTIAFESCENRCFKSNETITVPSSITSCDCDENCQDRNSCCPDFTLYCISEYTTDATEDATTLDETTFSSINLSPTTASGRTTNQKPYFETTTPWFVTKSTTMSSTSSTKPKTSFTPSILITKIPTSTFKTSTTTKIPKPSTFKTSTTTKIPTTSAFKVSTTTKKPTASTFKTSTMTRTTARMTFTSSTSTKPYSTQKRTTSSTFSSTLPTSSSPSSSSLSTSGKTIRLIHDVATFPTTTENRDTKGVQLNNNNNNDDDRDNKEFEENIEPEVIDEKTKPSMTAKPNNSLTVKAVIVCTAVVFVVLIIVFVSRKYSVVRCLKMKRMRSSNGDSQSDVRFLTSDEVLDFTLATPSTRRSYN